MFKFIESKTSQKLSKKRVLSFEEKNCVILPEDYSLFLLETLNGGSIDCIEPLIEVDGWGQIVVNSIYGIETETNYDIERKIWLIGDDILPKGSLPIANDPGGNAFFLATEPPHRGKVYFHFHEEEPNDPPTIDNNPSLWHVADSFTEFLEKIKV